MELQSLQVSTPNPHQHSEVNLFYPRESSTTENEFHRSHLKLIFPRFDGQKSQRWIYKLEHYFDYKSVPPEQQVSLAAFHLEGLALQWQLWFSKYRGPVSWGEFSKALFICFSPTNFEDPSKALTRLRQTTTIEVYKEAFENLSHQVDGLPESFLVGCFIAGLKDNIRLDVKIKHPRTLVEAIRVARLIEERSSLLKKPTTFTR